MIAELIDRRRLKAEMKALLADAQVCPKGMTALYLGLITAMTLVLNLIPAEGVISTFVTIFVNLLSWVLGCGFTLYCMAVRRGERAEYLTLFDGFSFAGKLIALNLLIYVFVSLWAMLFLVPGIIAAYRYRFALYNLYENPGIGVMEALEMSKRQAAGYKGQLFTLDLTYMGWVLLAALPILIESGLLSYDLSISTLSGEFAVQAAGLPKDLHSILPAWAWALIGGLWELVVSLFYLPVMQCTELGYFEIAKRTSGVGLRDSSEGPADPIGF